MPRSDYELISIKPSSNREKKLVAVFKHKTNGRPRTTHFGAKGMSDYTIHKDPARKARYLARHRTSEDWNDPTTAGALSRWVLWNKPSLRASIADYKAHFNL